MKAVFERLSTEQSSSFILRQFDVPKFEAPFHFHPEYELTLILKGEGQRYIGQQVNEFVAGDLVFLGANLPHCWVNQPIENKNAFLAHRLFLVFFCNNMLKPLLLIVPDIPGHCCIY